MRRTYVIGLDYGTLSGRGVLVCCQDGEILASAVKEYEHGVMTRFLPDGKTELPDAWCLEYPKDYLNVLEYVIPEILKEGKVDKEDVVGIGVDFTACTMLPIDSDGVPLCEKEKFADHRNAYAKLWKHHGAQAKADRINEVLEELGWENEPRFGGKVSSELMLPKIMEMLEEDPQVYEAADEILEAGDWITRILTDSHNRSCSMAGYKSWWDKKEGYPSAEFFKKLHPALEFVTRDKMAGEVCQIGEPVGRLSQAWAKRLGLSSGTAVAPAIIDSHAGVPGSGLYHDKQAMLVLGTSSVLVGLSDHPYSAKGICGAVEDAIVPGYYAWESGLASVGDLFGWFTDQLAPEAYVKEAEEKRISIHTLLSEKACRLSPGESGILALDWWNGNKTPFVNGNLTGTLFGLTLETKPEEIYRALIEATAFGTQRILELYEENGCSVQEIVASGGITGKNPLLMQIYADVLNKKIRIAASDQAAALGAAVYASLAAGKEEGGYDSYWEAVKKMGKLKEDVYVPIEKNVNIYKKLYSIYTEFSDIIGDKCDSLLLQLRNCCQKQNQKRE